MIKIKNINKKFGKLEVLKMSILPSIKENVLH